MTNNTGLPGTLSVKARKVPGKPGQAGHPTLNCAQMYGLITSLSAGEALQSWNPCSPAGGLRPILAPLFFTVAPRPAVKTADTSRKILPDPSYTLAQGWVEEGMQGPQAAITGKVGNCNLTRVTELGRGRMGTPSSYPCSFIPAPCLWRGPPVSTRGNTSFAVGVGVVLTSGFHTVPAQHLIGMLGGQ